MLSLELERKEAASERATTILAIEEPEAHLHPHLQRLVFRDFLRRDNPVLLTTHSPHIASVAPLASILLLRQDQTKMATVGVSTHEAELSPQNIEDLERYLDATRAEMLFAKRVILVEGPSEMFLLPAFALKFATPLDEYGVTICSVLGTDFVPYVRLLGEKGLRTPFVVVTDGDWFEAANGETLSRGYRRSIEILKAGASSGLPEAEVSLKDRKWADIDKVIARNGVFVGNRTLEVDLFNSGYGPEMITTFKELGAPAQMVERTKTLSQGPVPINPDMEKQLLNDIEQIGKGRFSQRLASKIDKERCPQYKKLALTHVVKEQLKYDG